jgi:hypothetical protein
MRYFTAAAVFAIGEVAGLFIFAAVKRAIGPPETSPARKASVVKGILERAVMFTGLLNGFPQILIAFGALKLGTRLHEEKQSCAFRAFALVTAINNRCFWQQRIYWRGGNNGTTFRSKHEIW